MRALGWILSGITLTVSAQSPEAEARLVAAARTSPVAYETLASLCDEVGPRLSGSPGYDLAVQWAVSRMKAAGLSNVHTERAMVRHWVRGEGHAEVLLPFQRALHVAALGGSVGTPQGGLTADVVAVASLDELARLPPDRVRGRILLVDQAWTNYGPWSRLRSTAADAASRKGAVAVLIGGGAPKSLDTVHTGVMEYGEAPPIPMAALTAEHSSQLHRLADKGTRIRLHLDLGCQTLPDVDNPNVIGEIPGSGLPGEVVLLSGHLDSWDLGQGAQDDGVGCVLALEAARLIRAQNLKPRRTLRVVFYSNEESGLRGGEAYLQAHRQELPNHVAALESDGGNGLAKGFTLDVTAAVSRDEGRRQAALKVLRRLRPHLEPLGAGTLNLGGSGADISPIVREGVPGLGMSHEGATYFEVHHTAADTFDKIRKADLDTNVAILAVAAYVLADMPDRLVPR
jgi:carboxypeptidase Q